METITVPKEIVFTEAFEQAIRDYNDFAQKQDKGNEVPPIPHTYPTNDEGRYMAEFHHAISTRKEDWKKFPAYKLYINARENQYHS